MTAELYRDQHAHALIAFDRGKRLLRALTLSPLVRVRRFQREDERYFTPLLYRGAPYPLRRALRHFKRAGQTLGITKSARIVLRSLKEAE